MPELTLESTAVQEAPAVAPPQPEPIAAPKPAEATKPARLVSLDAYRGFIMLAMASSGFAFSVIARRPEYKDSALWKFLAYQFDHVEWTGCGFWDLIQPSFMFMVGVAIPYSYAARKAKGESEGHVWFHTVLRAFVLVALGVFLASSGAEQKQTNFLFTNVLAQIGLGYCFVFALHGKCLKVQMAMLAAILAGYWLLFALFPLPPEGFDLNEVGITSAWNEAHGMTGLAAHWNKNTNAAAWFDQWFLNLFPRAKEFVFERGGYQTLNFIPSMATMILGLMAGEMLRGPRSKSQKFLLLCAAGLVCLGIGFVLDFTGICPSVKRIWTPSWAIYSSGWTFLMLAGFFAIIDIAGYQRWAFALVIVGMNSIAVYMIAQLLKVWTWDTLRKHLGVHIFEGTYFSLNLFDPIFEPIAKSVAFLAVLWLVSLWMYRQKIFVKI
jgi:heparan-alpha-glucosaminide N-acetyltransferase